MPKRKVLIVNGTLAAKGGGDHVAALIVEALRERFDITLLIQKPPDVEGLNRVFGTALRHEDFRVVTMPRALRSAVSILPFRLALLRRALQFRQARRMIDDFDFVFSVDNEIDVAAPAVQYIHFPWGLLPRPRSDLRWYHRFPGLIASYYAMIRWLIDVKDERIAANLTFVNSRWTGEKYAERYRGAESVILHPPAQVARDVVPWGDRELQFVAVGRISPEKKLEDAIEILDRVRKRGHDVRLVIVGLRDNRWCFAKISALARARSWVTIREGIPHGELLETLQRSRYGIHAMPHEHFGIVVAQMLANGCVPFVRNDGGPFEIVRDERLAFGSIDEAANRIDEVLRDAAMQEELRRATAERAEDFGVESFRRNLLAAIQEWMEGRVG